MREKTTGPEDRPHSDDDKGEEQRITSDVPGTDRIGHTSAAPASTRPERRTEGQTHKLTTPEVLRRDGAERGGLSDCVSKTILIVGVTK